MKNININKIHYKPECEFGKIDIFGRSYVQRTVSPNLYVIDTNDVIEEGSTISFKHDCVLYTLEGVSTLKSEGMTFIECRNFIEEYIEQ